MSLSEFAATARGLASGLFRADDARCYGPTESSCIEEEGSRPLTKAEVNRGWCRRPFWAYDVDRMCNSCLAYFHAERAAQVLHELACVRTKLSSGSRE